LREKPMPLKGHSPNTISLGESLKRGIELAYEVASSIFQMDNPAGQGRLWRKVPSSSRVMFSTQQDSSQWQM